MARWRPTAACSRINQTNPAATKFTCDRCFLMITERGRDKTGTSPQIVMVQNWTEELKRLVPTK